MPTLREIRNKLHSVENIKKITQAMEMVAASRLRRSQAKTEKARPYFYELKEILHYLLLASKELTHPLIQKRVVHKTGLIVVAADRGLCGSYNHNILTAATQFLKNYSPEQVELILIGQKTVNHFAGKKWKVHDRVVDWGDKMPFERVQALTQDLIRYFLAEGLDEIWLIYTHYHTIMTREVMVEKFLNIEFPPEKQEKNALNYIFEPNEQAIFEEILPRYCVAKLQLALNEAFTSELAARIVAMRGATKNAEDMIENLTLVRNKVRQASITNELIEITSGAANLK